MFGLFIFLAYVLSVFYDVIGLLFFCFFIYIMGNSNVFNNKAWYHWYRVHYAGNQKHTFHIVTRSPWPLYSSIAGLIFFLGMVMYMHNYLYGGYIVLWGLFLVVLMLFVWWRDIIRESTYGGYHTKKVQQGLRYGMLLFITTEVMFFAAFFWAFFHSSLSPSIVLGSVWPPVGINVLNPLQIPLLNTLILLLSGFTVTWSHHIIRDKSWQKTFIKEADVESESFIDNFIKCYGALLATILLGIEFTAWQAYEYYKATFYIFDGIYGSTFYMTTGLHGLHVLIGTLFLIVCFFRLIKLHFLHNHHFGYEAAIWYWHFVDVVWIFLFLSIYCWGSGINSFTK